ncbi:MAG: hypothetical protein ACRC18_06350 [Cetobacterium sp.]
MAARNRISVNFSKKYSKEYELILKEDNASELICELLKKHYEGNVSNEDIMNKLDKLFDKLKGGYIEEDEDLDDAIDAWD